jgi:tRNA/tmRNA/rRNA uracil-C5-methylase (TrmA/RlmC/RlmD family)
VIELDVGNVAHGGFCVARHEGRVVFVRHALPGERVRAVVTQGEASDRFWRADAVEILTPSPDRVAAPCPYAHPGGCGGCDWQHASLPAQRRLKAAVVEEQLSRLAGLSMHVVVESVAGDHNGLGWRTRVKYAVGPDGRAGLRRHRSHDIEPIDECLIAHPDVRVVDVLSTSWDEAESVEVVASSLGDTLTVVDGEPRRGFVTEGAAGRLWRVTGGGFWQVHPGAADALVNTVLDAARPNPGEKALDLYAGVGLFAGALAERLGPTGAVLAIEGSGSAVKDARRNLRDLSTVEIVKGRVDQVLSHRPDDEIADIVVLDPPRTGAKAKVVGQIARRRPRVVAYVACDPAALARDVATFGEHGYGLTRLHAFDLFPMTHHVECVALLVRVGSDLG